MSTTKQRGNLKAQCALGGITLIASSDDCDQYIHIAWHWSLTSILATMYEVRHWLAMVTGKSLPDLMPVEKILASLMGEIRSCPEDVTTPNMDR